VARKGSQQKLDVDKDPKRLFPVSVPYMLFREIGFVIAGEERSFVMELSGHEVAAGGNSKTQRVLAVNCQFWQLVLAGVGESELGGGQMADVIVMVDHFDLRPLQNWQLAHSHLLRGLGEDDEA
jgi:hypothetical protein